MKKFEITDHIHVGGCVGVAVDITDEHVIVQGTYHYYDTRMETDPTLKIWDEWQFRYKIEDFSNAVWDEKMKW